MAEKFDVSSRLAEGRAAVENLQQYVLACHQLGYQNPDLTLHAAQLRDWYGSEDGMDLQVLQSDCLALEDAVRSTADAVAVQERQLMALPTVWQGDGAEASRDFLRRHGEASAAVAAAVRTAAEALGALRENLWRAVDGKVDAVEAIEGGSAGVRADWLAAAATVTTGAGDRVAAAEMIDHAVKPFVDSRISTDWLTAMHTAMSSVADAYQRAASELAAEGRPVFAVPGDLGPSWSPPPAAVCDEVPDCENRTTAPATVPAGATAPAAAMPSAWSAPPAPPAPAVPLPAPAVPLPAPAVPLPAAPTPLPEPLPPAPPMSPMSAMPSLGGMGSGMPGLGGGLSGLGQQFADTLGGLLGASDSAAPDPPKLDIPELDDPPVAEEKEAADKEAADEEAADEEAADEEAEADEEEQEPADGGEEPVDDAAACEVPAPAPTPPPPPAEPLPPADPLSPDPSAAEQTPCAIAADELPQVGDPSE